MANFVVASQLWHVADPGPPVVQLDPPVLTRTYVAPVTGQGG